MVLGKPLNSVRSVNGSQQDRTSALLERNMENLIDRHRKLFEENAELRNWLQLQQI